KYQRALTLFELDEEKTVAQLSAGMRVKYLIALALSHHAKLLILDEPTSGLDPVSRDDLLTLFKQLIQDGERSILFSTHITSDLEKCADALTYIKEGSIIANTEKTAFIKRFQTLKDHTSDPDLSLEDIMIRIERKNNAENFDL
ncbi:MAG: AAA family ATPase, partial [Eubacterium sp.]